MPKLSLNEKVLFQHAGGVKSYGKVIAVKVWQNRELYEIQLENDEIYRAVPSFTILTDLSLGWIGFYKITQS